MDFLRNFSSLSQQVEQDHYFLFNLVEDDGFLGDHVKVGFQEQAGDPTTGANEVALFTKEFSGSSEIFFAPESAGTVKRFTTGGEWSYELQVVAFVMFDGNGGIIQQEDGTPYSLNVTSVTAAAGQDDFVINFTNAISTTNLFWTIEAQFTGPNRTFGDSGTVNYQPKNNGAYASTITTSSFAITGYTTNTTAADNISRLRTGRVTFTAYKVVS